MKLFSTNTTLSDIIRERATDVAEYNALYQLTRIIRPETRSESASYSVKKTDIFNDIDASSGDVTCTLPADPYDRETHIFANNSGTNNVIISGNGKNINGSSTQSFSTQYAVKHVVYIEDAGEWRYY